MEARVVVASASLFPITHPPPQRSQLVACPPRLFLAPSLNLSPNCSPSRRAIMSWPSAAELRDESDFLSLAESGLVSICGFGSLLSERSARSTFPELKGFRVAKLRGYRRVFAHAVPIFFQRGIANPLTKEISSLSVEPCDGETLIVTIFEISKSEIPAFMERELEFRFLAVVPEMLDGQPYERPAVLCARYSDDEFLEVRCKGSKCFGSKEPW